MNRSTNPEAMWASLSQLPIGKPLNKGSNLLNWNSKQSKFVQLTWNRIFAMTSHCGWVNDRNSLMTLVRISFGGTRSRIIWHKTFPNISPALGVVYLIRWNNMSIRSVDCNITSGSSWTMPFEFSVFFSWSFEPIFAEEMIWKFEQEKLPIIFTYWYTNTLSEASMPVLKMPHYPTWKGAMRFARFYHENHYRRCCRQSIVGDPN